MYQNKKFLAVIPARGGSKGIPKKNIIQVNGKPLIYYTIHEALKSKYLDSVIISTDSVEIAETARACGGEVPFLRPANLATDTAKTIDVLVHAIEELKKVDRIYDYLVLLQPTQPLRKAFHIDEAIERIIKHNETSLVSVSEVRDHPILIRSIDEKGMLKSLLPISSSVRRQDFTDYFKVNGAIYINKIDSFFDSNLSLNDNEFPYIMDSKYDLDIDNWEDIESLILKMK